MSGYTFIAFKMMTVPIVLSYFQGKIILCLLTILVLSKADFLTWNHLNVVTSLLD